MAWPPRSPDLIPMDFFLWGHIKASIYTLPVDSNGDLTAHIVQPAVNTRQQPDNFQYSCQSLMRRHWLCIEVSGHIFEHLL